MSAFRKEFDRITFRSLPGRSFRGRLSQSQQFTSLWLEDRETKRQWSLDIVDVNEYAPNGVTLPPSSVVDVLKQAMESASSGKDVEIAPGNAVVDAETGDQGMNVILKCYLFHALAPEYKFPMNPVEIDPMLLLESQLRDASEEIRAARKEIAELKTENMDLRKHRIKGFFTLCSKDYTSPQNPVIWNGTAYRELSEFVTLSADKKTLKIVHPGVYQIYVLLTHFASGCQMPLFALRMNGKCVGEVASNNLNSSWQSAEITEILRLNRNDELDVFFAGDNCYGVNGRELASRFSGIYLSD